MTRPSVRPHDRAAVRLHVETAMRWSMRSTGALLALSLLPAVALADFTVTIKNETDAPVQIEPRRHYCIHDPTNFHKLIPSGESVQIAANWVDGCGGLEMPYIMLYVSYGYSDRCFLLQEMNKFKSLLVVADQPDDLPYLVRASDRDLETHDCYPVEPPDPSDS